MSRSREFVRWLLFLVPSVTVLGLLLILGSVEAVAAPSSAPALGITPTNTATPTSTATPTPTPTATPTRTSSGVCDPIITKRAEPTEVRPGDEVLFTIEVTNRGRKDSVNTVVIDDVPGYMENVDDQKVTVKVGTIGQDFVVEILIYTRVLEDAPAPLSLENLATVWSDNCPDPSARAVVRIIGDGRPHLPVTGGYSTWWLLAAVLGTGLVGVSLALSRRSEG